MSQLAARELSGRYFLGPHVGRELAPLLGSERLTRDVRGMQIRVADRTRIRKYARCPDLRIAPAYVALRPVGTEDVMRVVEIADDGRVLIVPLRRASTHGGIFAPHSGIALDIHCMNCLSGTSRILLSRHVARDVSGLAKFPLRSTILSSRTGCRE